MTSEIDLYKGYTRCQMCANGVHLNQAGFDVPMYICSLCKCDVADKDDFFNVNLDVEILSK